MSETGYQTEGIKGWGSIAEEANESNPDLQWPDSIEVFDRMRKEDAQVGSVLRAVTLPVRKTAWHIDGTGCRPEVVALVSADLGVPILGQPVSAPLRTKGRLSWSEHVRLALTSLPFGYSYFEQVYKPEGGLLHLSKLAWRPPRTISDIEVAKDGGLVAIKQHAVAGSSDVRIPVDRLVAYVNEREGGNWLGQSLLRTAYKNWLLKDRLIRIQALVAERNGLGVPLYTAAPPPDASLEELRAWQEAEKKAGLELTKGFRAGESAGAAVPHGADLELLGVTGKLPDTDGPIRYHDEQIARAVLAHFLNLGTETGSWALGSTFANFFADSLNAVAGHMADVTQQHVIEDLVDWNWGTSEPAPRLVFKAIGAEHPATAEAIKALLDSGALKWDPALEAHLRAQYGLPVAQPTTDPAPAPKEET